MARAMTTRWSSEWTRWIGWTLAYALVTGVCTLAHGASIGCKGWPRGLPVVADVCDLVLQALPPGSLPAWSLAYLMPLLIAAFVIGVRFPFKWWPAAPPLVVFLVGTPLLQIPYDAAVPHMPWQIFQGMTYATTMFLAVVVMLLGWAILFVLLALGAVAGVRWGRRREQTRHH